MAISVQKIEILPFNQTVVFTFNPESAGIVVCEATNSQGKSEARAKVLVNDLNETLSVWSSNKPPISIGDDVSVFCGASVYNYSSELNWYKDNVPVVNSSSK